MLKICKYNIVICFKLHRITFFLSPLVVCSMFVTFLQEVICVTSGFDAYRLVLKLIEHHPLRHQMGSKVEMTFSA